MESFKTIFEDTSCELKVKGSIFIANVFYVKDLDDVNRKIEQIANKYKDATHNVPAYRVYDSNSNQVIERAIDDGEPAGTAGKPILDVLKHKDLMNILVVVTRYFGGTLLGTGGLVKAYQGVTIEVVESSKIKDVNYYEVYNLRTNYECFNSIKKVLDSNKIKYDNISYDLEISIDFYINTQNREILEKITNEYYNNVIIRKVDAIYM